MVRSFVVIETDAPASVFTVIRLAAGSIAVTSPITCCCAARGEPAGVWAACPLIASAGKPMGAIRTAEKTRICEYLFIFFSGNLSLNNLLRGTAGEGLLGGLTGFRCTRVV